MRTTRSDRRKNINNYRSWVYGLYDNGLLVYVGVTSDPERRLIDHVRNKVFDEMRLIRGFSSRDRAEQFENVCIEKFDGLMNIAKLTPRPVGFRQATPSNSKRDMSAWTGAGSVDFDFSLLDNPTIRRRKKSMSL